MAFVGDDRGQAIQIGFVLVLGILVISASLFQAVIVPNQNATVEFNHYQDVRSDMTDLYTEIVSLGSSSKTGQVLVPVNLGTRYPARLIFINPPPATGTIRSTGGGTMSIEVAGSSDSIADICGGATTTGIVYSPSYQESTLPQIRYENGLLYVETADGDNAMLEQRPVVNRSSRTIDLYRTTGRLGPKSEVGTLPIELTGTRTYGRVNVSVERVTLPSDLSAATWNEAVLPAGISASSNGTAVDLTGFGGQNYTVRCFSTGLGERPETNFEHAASY